jgi:hypothetical protein
MNSEKYIGLDVHQATIVVAVTVMSPKLLVVSTTYKTLVALEKACKKH